MSRHSGSTLPFEAINIHVKELINSPWRNPLFNIYLEFFFFNKDDTSKSRRVNRTRVVNNTSWDNDLYFILPTDIRPLPLLTVICRDRNPGRHDHFLGGGKIDIINAPLRQFVLLPISHQSPTFGFHELGDVVLSITPYTEVEVMDIVFNHALTVLVTDRDYVGNYATDDSEAGVRILETEVDEVASCGSEAYDGEDEGEDGTMDGQHSVVDGEDGGLCGGDTDIEPHHECILNVPTIRLVTSSSANRT